MAFSMSLMLVESSCEEGGGGEFEVSMGRGGSARVSSMLGGVGVSVLSRSGSGR